MGARKHDLVNVNGVRIHTVEEGEGPLVILVHGFPELWYSWRFQLPAIAKAGYRVVAIDQRGYGRSSKFWDPDAYRIHRMVDDLVGLVGALGYKDAILIGHDWGAPVVWTAAWLHPKLFKGVMGVSVPFAGRAIVGFPGSPFGEVPPVEIHKVMAGPGQDFYQEYFGALTNVITEIEADLRGWLLGLTWIASGDYVASSGLQLDGADPVALTRASALCVEHGKRMCDRFAMPDKMPAWFTEADLDVFADALERGGFAGPLSYYRNIENDWNDLAPQQGKPLEVPAMFLGGEYDVGTWWGAEALARAPEVIPNWMGSRILKGAGHWIQQEQPEETNAVILEFLRALR